VICAQCGTENRAGRKFCASCGHALAVGCPSCGAPNETGERFCGECGAALPGASAPPAVPARPAGAPTSAPAIPTAERRLVSILFADLVGFTPFAEERDSEDVRETLGRYFEIAGEVIGRYGGTVEKFIGDAVMAVWGAPIAREDDAERAVRAALELVDAVRAVGPGVQARAGVLTGEAAVTLGATNQGMVAGDLVNTAARLQSVALPGTVLVGEATRHAAAGAIAFEEAGDHTLKGKAAPVPAWRAVRVVAERGGRGRSDALEAPFVGRDDELRLMKDLYHATVREGRIRLVSITGIGGIGKSRLVWELEKYLDGISSDIWWHRGRSPAYGEGITFWALGEMIRGRAGLAETDDERTTRARIAELVRAHVPDPAERSWIEASLLALLGVEAAGGSEQLFGAWRTFFERLAGTGPVVMVFEDLHWADGGTLDFIDHLQEWSRTVPLLIVTLARPELLDRRPDWGAGKRSFTSVYLEPLPEDTMRELLAGLVPGLPAAARDAIVARADGIPLYAVETVRMLLAQGRVVIENGVYRPVDDLAGLAVPETLTALISARLDEIDSFDRALVADGAVLGQSFTLAGLAAVSGQDPAAIEPRLRALVRRELLVQTVDPRSPERGQYAFVQSLIREVAYNTLSKRDRKARHLAAARYLESLGTDEIAAALAGQYLAAQAYAADGPEADALAAQARVALRAAADRAVALGAHAQAITFLEHALGVSPAAADRADLHERALASALQGLVGEVVERHALGALEAWRELGDRARIAIATAAYANAMTDFTGSSDRAMPLLRDAWQEFSDLEETEAGVAVMLYTARTLALIDDHEALEWVERLLPVAERLDLLEYTSRGLGLLSGILYRLGRPRQALILLRGTHEMAVANGLAETDQNTRTSLTFYQQFNDPAAGLEMARDGLAIAGRMGSAVYGFLMVGNAVSCAIRLGEWAWSEALLEEWLANEITGAFYLELYVDRAILTSLRGGDPAADLAVAEGLVGAIEDPQYRSFCHWGRAWAQLTAGRLGEACEQAALAADVTPYFVPISLPLAVRAALWAGDTAAAGVLATRLQATVSRGQAVTLDHLTLRAGIAALEGRRTEAIAGYREALRGWRALGTSFDEALAALDMAILLEPTEDEMPDAAAAVEVARETLARLGAAPLLARLEESRAAAMR